jgi:hypothetical protein
MRKRNGLFRKSSNIQIAASMCFSPVILKSVHVIFTEIRSLFVSGNILSGSFRLT